MVERRCLERWEGVRMNSLSKGGESGKEVEVTERIDGTMPLDGLVRRLSSRARRLERVSWWEGWISPQY